jgi:hypothetical protein
MLMLLFKPEHKAPILAGTKTQTRRIWKSWRANVRSTQRAKTKMLSKEHFAKLYIIDRWEERLGDISEDDARAEGYASREEYLAKFAEINAKQIKKLPYHIEEIPVKVLSFKVIS